MKYALLIYSTPGSADNATPPAGDDGVIDNWVDYTVAIRGAGVMLGAERLNAAETATAVTLRDGERLLTDGPFIETKEHLNGFYLVDVPDLDTALNWAARMPAVRYGHVEVRPVREGEEWQAALT
jgi:hypothetical protein